MKTYIKWAFFLIASIFLLFGGVRRLYYFHDEMIYAGGSKDLNPAYADQIDVELYLMSLPNVIDLFEGKSPNPDTCEITWDEWSKHNNPDDLTRPRTYLVVRLKNRGDQIAWGVLEHTVEGRKIKRMIDVPPLAPQASGFKNIILFPGRAKNIPGPYPELKASWLKLYTKNGEKK